MVMALIRVCVVFAVVLSCAAVYALDSDFNGDDIVDLSDFALFAAHWLEGTSYVEANQIFESRFPSVSLVRDSIAYDSYFNQVAANIGRFEKICISSRPTLTLFADPTDPNISRLAYDVDGDLVILAEKSNILRVTNDGLNYITLADTSSTGSEPFRSHVDPDDNIKAVKVLPDGSWILSSGRKTQFGNKGNLFRSTNKGYAWTWVHQFENGYSTSFGMSAIADNEIAICEYNSKYQIDNPRRVYYSNDYGATWHKIYEPIAQFGRHSHVVAFKPGDTDVIYISYGDGEYAKVTKIEFSGGDKTDAANWSEVSGMPITTYDPTMLFADGTNLYCGRDGAGYEPVLLKIDTTTDHTSTTLNWPSYVNSESSPYHYQNPYGDVYSMLKYKGIYYVAVRDIYNQVVGGIYVSTDLKHWVCAYRVEGDDGFEDIVGFANGYLWGTYCNSTTRTLYKLDPVEARLVSTLRVERGITNLHSADESSFEGNLGSWQIPASDDISVSRVTDESLHGSYCMKNQGVDKGKGLGRARTAYMAAPDINDYIVASFWIKLAESWPDNYLITATLGTSPLDIPKISKKVSYVYAISDPNAISDWQKIVLWGKSLSNDWEYGPRVEIMIDDMDGGNFSDAVCYVDCVQMVYLNDLHYSGSWHIGGTTRANEVAYCPMTGLGSEFTATFEWRPDCSSREWHGDIPIGTITDNNNYIDLYYDQYEQKFVLTDGTNSAITTRTFTWEHLDSIKFAVTNLNLDFRLSIQSPKDGTEHILTDNTATKLVRPTGLALGTNDDKLQYGCGLFANIKTFDLALSTSEIEAQFNLP